MMVGERHFFFAFSFFAFSFRILKAFKDSSLFFFLSLSLSRARDKDLLRLPTTMVFERRTRMKKNAFFFRGVVFGNPLFRVSKKNRRILSSKRFFSFSFVDQKKEL